MYLATIDCGTTNSRVYIIRDDGKILGKGTRNVGVRDTSITGSKDKLKDGLASAFQEALDSSGLQLNDIACAIAAGMITSEIGLVDIPHIQTPAGLDDLAKGLQKIHDTSIFPIDIPIYFVPGIRNRFDPATATPEIVGELDFMRGEETQVMGYLSKHPTDRPVLIIILSSHTKFIYINESAKVERSLTTLSGQVYEAVKKETFIGKSIEKQAGIEAPDEYMDPKVIENAWRWREHSGFVRCLLMIRFLDVLLDTSWYERRLFFESLLAAEDFQTFTHFGISVEDERKPDVVIIGPVTRCNLYQYMLMSKFNYPIKQIDRLSDTNEIDMLNIVGSLSIARTAGIFS